MSNLLRAEAVKILDFRPTTPTSVDAPRVFGRRLLREQQVGLETPIPLPVPNATRPRLLDAEPTFEDTTAPAGPPPNLAELEEAARRAGFNVGHAEGYAAGLAAAEQAMAGEVQRLREILARVYEDHATLYRSAERQVVDLALQIAEKVVEREVENMPDLAVNVIRAALDEMDARTALRVRVSPDDLELLQRRWSQLVPPSISPDQVELAADERIQPGGAIIETTQGQVDAQLETKLAQLGNALWTFVSESEADTDWSTGLANAA